MAATRAQAVFVTQHVLERMTEVAAPLPSRPRTIRPGIRLSIRGRSVKVRGLRISPTGWMRWLAILGPGVIASVAGDDAGGIGTISAIGARYGYELLWMLLPLTLSLAVVQEMAARVGAASGRGLLDLVRERFGIGWAFVAVGAIVIANAGVVVTEFAGVAAAAELIGLNRWLAVPFSAAAIWALVLFGTYSRAERLFLVMTLVFLAYPAAALLAQPNWGDVARGGLLPAGRSDPGYLLIVLALIGTTLTPYQQLFQQSAVVERGIAARHYADERLDAYLGAVLGNLIWAFVMIATGATLHATGVLDIQTARDAAQALQPVAGSAAAVLFAVGLLGASLLAAGVVPVATAYSATEAFGFRKGVGLDFRRAPVFYGLFTVLIAVGAVAALLPGVPLIPLLIDVQMLNGLLLPVVLTFLLLLSSDRRLMGGLRNTPVQSAVGWLTVLATGAVAAALVFASLRG
jgi:NRAMP (natural resistance-associated macrophage protein)-like metal ion transporter